MICRIDVAAYPCSEKSCSAVSRILSLVLFIQTTDSIIRISVMRFKVFFLRIFPGDEWTVRLTPFMGCGVMGECKALGPGPGEAAGRGAPSSQSRRNRPDRYDRIRCMISTHT